MQKFIEYASIIVLDIAAIVLIALQMKFAGWMLLGIGALLLLFCRKQFRKNVFLLYFSIGLLGITPITTDISYFHMFQMGVLLTLAIAVPYVISRYVYKDHMVRFKFHHGRKWYKSEILYIGITAILSYILLPFLLRETGSYHNWSVTPGIENLITLFIGTNALGIWDELFFVSTALGILRRFLPFGYANLAQSVLFTSFLYELGFRGYMFIIIFIFALIQGYIFKKTESLFYVITVHLTLDFILYLVLIYLHHPQWLPIFFT